MQASKIYKIGEEILKSKSLEVTNFGSKELEELIEYLFYNLEYYHGAGIAAPQIGVNKRIFVYGFEGNARYPGIAPIKKTVIINPIINFFSEQLEDFYEGCLSIPNIRGQVPRHHSIKITAHDFFGKEIKLSCSGFEARVIQHEIDHLDGILFPMRMTDLNTLTYSET